jgi:hypothetical protein
MDAYTRELRAGDRAALAARYDEAGAYLVGPGGRDLLPSDAIAARYRDPAWQPPAAFAWQELSFDALGPDAVLVVGRFVWTRAPGQPPVRVDYSAVLRRRAERLRIRLEDQGPIAVGRADDPPAVGDGRPRG